MINERWVALFLSHFLPPFFCRILRSVMLRELVKFMSPTTERLTIYIAGI